MNQLLGNPSDTISLRCRSGVLPAEWAAHAPFPAVTVTGYDETEGGFGDGGDTINGGWEQSRDGELWRSDFDVTCTRVGKPQHP